MRAFVTCFVLGAAAIASAQNAGPWQVDVIGTVEDLSDGLADW